MEAMRRTCHHGLNASFGNAEDAELSASLHLAEASCVVSAVHDSAINRALIAALSKHGYAGQTAVTAHGKEDSHALKKLEWN